MHSRIHTLYCLINRARALYHVNVFELFVFMVKDLHTSTGRCTDEYFLNIMLVLYNETICIIFEESINICQNTHK